MPEDTERHWIEALADLEKERRAEAKITIDAVKKFRTEFQKAVVAALSVYGARFPEEWRYIDHGDQDSEGFSLITRSQHDGGPLKPPVQARVRFSVEKMAMECKFSAPFHKHLEKDFPFTQHKDGSIGLAEGGSAADAARYLLEPILFPMLKPNSK